MAITTVVFGILLIALGVAGKLGTGTPSITPLIPAFLGGVFVLLGLLALKESLLKHTMHLAAMLGLLGFLGAAGRIIGKWARGESVSGPAGLSTVAMAVLCALFVGLCINSFLAARRRRRAHAAAEALAKPEL